MDSSDAPGPAGPPPAPAGLPPAPAGLPPAPRPPWWANGPRWPGVVELRADARGALTLTGVLLACGIPAGLLWWAVAPRARFRVTADGPVVVGHPSAELLAAVDSVYTLVLAGLGLLAGVGTWRLRRRRGVAVLLALGVGTLLAALVAWRVGELLAPGPTEAQLADAGTTVTTGLALNSLAALAAGPFAAVLAYVVAALFAASEDLDRPAPTPPSPLDGGYPGAPPVAGLPRPLVDVPPAEHPGR
ncbi:hypothetical protein [Geodermatophilus sabuli]|uniref:DUF2567 domain-containing protein n=1 Tax=Geodermatophilus sabuli TaxID=1564158 RepID=A0A285E7T4_9ACTN|nr:hypothetical protein [Geodermatophilus sabuli]MBB3082061.1 hypothetical protein [Geodermatophilus sabuli]SNX95067.1 hypothetical protein SAMN06893097_101870 [Geodermatophilus sabuli]